MWDEAVAAIITKQTEENKEKFELEFYGIGNVTQRSA
jgi:hypothetical protein